jgi:hypothetical protein
MAARRPPNDYLSLNADGSFKRAVIGGEDVIFSDVVTKINRKDKPQERILVVTSKGVYNLSKSKKLKRRIDLTKVDAITVSTMSDEWVIHSYAEYDYRIACARKAEATECIVNARYDLTGDTVPVTLSSQLDLKGVVATRLSPRKTSTEAGSPPSRPLSPSAAISAAPPADGGFSGSGGSASSPSGAPPPFLRQSSSLSTAVGELGPIDEGDEDSD